MSPSKNQTEITNFFQKSPSPSPVKTSPSLKSSMSVTGKSTNVEVTQAACDEFSDDDDDCDLMFMAEATNI